MHTGSTGYCTNFATVSILTSDLVLDHQEEGRVQPR